MARKLEKLDVRYFHTGRKLGVRSDRLHFEKYIVNASLDNWTVCFTYDTDAVRDLFRVKDLPNNVSIVYLSVSADFDPQYQRFEDYANVFAITSDGEKEYDYKLSVTEKLYMKEELISEGII